MLGAGEVGPCWVTLQEGATVRLDLRGGGYSYTGLWGCEQRES